MMLRRIECWRMFCDLASRNGRTDPVLMALACAWAHELSVGANWLLGPGVRSLLLAWPSAIRDGFRRRARNVPSAEKAGFEVLFVPQFSLSYYCAPCFALARAMAEFYPHVSVGLVHPVGSKGDEFRKMADEHGYTGPVLELDLSAPALSGPGLAQSARRLLTLWSLQGPPELANFFKAQFRKRCAQLLSAELLVGRLKAQLRRWGVRKLVTMNEQHYPANLLVAAANQLGIETHELLHGGLASPLYVPFQSRYCWPEYAASARQLECFGADPARLLVEPGVQVAAHLQGRSVPKPRAAAPGRKRTLLLLAQYHGYSTYGHAFFRDAILTVLSAVGRRKHEWDVTIRPHPCDRETDLEEMQRMLGEAGLAGKFADARTDLAAEAVKASLVVSAASSAIFTCIAAGTPASLIWGHAQTEAHGQPPLTPEWVVYDTDGLTEILDRVASKPDGPSSFARQQLAALGLNDFMNAPKRFCQRLLDGQVPRPDTAVLPRPQRRPQAALRTGSAK